MPRSRKTTRLAVALFVWSVLAFEAMAAPVVIDAAAFIDRTKADCGLQRPIELAAAAGGGMVLIPAGTYQLRCGLILRDEVSLVGAGMDRTVLTPAQKPERIEIVEDLGGERRMILDHIPRGLVVGSSVVACDKFPPASRNDPCPCIVTAINREMHSIRVTAPYGRPRLKPGVGLLIYGDSVALESTVLKGDWEVVLKSTELFRPGDEVTFGAPTNESLLAHAFVHAVDGNRLILKRPARSDFEAWPAEPKLEGVLVNALVWNVFPMIHGAHVKGAAISDLTVQGHGLLPVRTTQNRWTLAGIHFFDAQKLRIQRVAVRSWPSDGISLQSGDRCRVLGCEITGVLGSGLHPGTGLTRSVFSRNVVEGCGAGLYFCWCNDGHVLRYNRFVGNVGGGITGLGDPYDRNNTVRGNYVAYNGTYGIEINGGGDAGNVLRDNIVENNSQSEPGKYPGIVISSLADGARGYTISGNVVRDTQSVTTQHVGIEEQRGSDRNLITGNRFSGHSTADVIRVGPKTVVQHGREKPIGGHKRGDKAKSKGSAAKPQSAGENTSAPPSVSAEPASAATESSSAANRASALTPSQPAPSKSPGSVRD